MAAARPRHARPRPRPAGHVDRSRRPPGSRHGRRHDGHDGRRVPLGVARQRRRRQRLADLARQPRRERFQQQLLAGVEDERRARLVHERDRGPQAVRVAAPGVGLQHAETVGRVDQLGNAVRDARDVAEPEPGELEPLVERAHPRPALGALGGVRALALGAAAVALGQHLELGRDAFFDRRAGAVAGLPRLREEPEPGALAQVAGKRGAGVGLGMRPQRGSAARPVGVAQAEARRRVGGGGLEALLDREPLGEPLGLGRVEAHELAARGDRRQELAGPAREQDEVGERRGLLERLEHLVLRLLVHRLGPLDDEHAAPGLERRARRRGHDRLVDVADEHLGRAARRDPREVGMDAVADALAGGVGVARAVGEELGGERARRLALAGTGRAVEEVGVAGHAVGRQRRGQDRAGVGVTFGAGQHLWKATTMRGRLITIEGLDGAGKTTLADLLVPALASRGVEIALLREPGGVELSERIRTLVKDPALRVDPRAEALLYAAARAQLVAERVAPLLAGGRWVLLDRFVDSSLAYQGAGRALGTDAVRAINDFGTGGLVPDRTLLLTVDAGTRDARQAERGEAPDRLEREDGAFFAAIGAAYDELATAEPDRIRVLDASAAPDAVLEQALEALADLPPSRAGRAPPPPPPRSAPPSPSPRPRPRSRTRPRRPPRRRRRPRRRPRPRGPRARRRPPNPRPPRRRRR